MTSALLAALIAVESGGNNQAVGDNNRSIGCLQITEACVRDVNRIYGTHYRWPNDCFDRKKSVEICVAYLRHYGGKSKSLEKAARQWVGGPQGHRKPETRPYWKRVQQQLTTK
jgi:soluble lytic murein transglycosylase-like protein